MPEGKKFDLVVLIALEALASALSLLFSLTFLPSTVLFLAIPTAYLAFRLRRRSQWPRIIAMGLVFGVWYGYLFAYLADWNRIWAWPPESLSWGWFLGVNGVEWLWVALWILFIVLFYEHFVERDTASGISRRVLWAVAPAGVITTAIIAFTFWSPSFLTWSHAYAVLALLTLVPAVVLVARNPRIVWKLALPGLFFIPLHVAYEATALALNQWYFPGQYFGLVPLPGHTGVPVEEFVLWIVLGSFLVLSYYELYIDDGK
ncbi:MAG: hypothetical protein AAB923_00245 [Patescibacteria group bacterium]